MTWHDKSFLACYFLALIIVQCIWQRQVFKRNKPISHFWHGVYYSVAVAPMIYFFREWWWQTILLAFFERLALFDFVLSKIRGKKLFYNGRDTTGSFTDGFENMFTDFWVIVFKIFYLIGFVIVLVKI